GVRVALPRARVLKVSHEREQAALHVAGLEDGLVMLRLELVRHELGFAALVEAELEAGRRGEVEAAGEGGDVRQRSGSKRRDAPRVHAPAQVGADGDVAHELTFDGLAE